MTATATMSTNALANWYGSNRMNADQPAKLLGKCSFIGVPFAGGMCELPYFKARQMVANDLHRHVINLARVVADPVQYKELKRRVAGLLYHPDTLAAAQGRCREWEAMFERHATPTCAKDFAPDVAWAVDYFVASWMGRGSGAGTKSEFTGQLSVRYTSGGGGSSVRYRSAVRSLDAWHDALERWEFETLDWSAFLDNCHDRPGYGLYVDAPWPIKGRSYKHAFTEQQQRELAARLRGYRETRVVVRYGDHPLIRELYPEGRGWAWHRVGGRNQANGEVDEVLIVKGDDE